jgi:methyl-accepting chemotaxis protein
MTTNTEKQSLLSRLSIPAKINLVVGVIFLLVIILVTVFVSIQERDRALEVAKQRTLDMTTLYFDGLNTMMLTGTMANREILHGKMNRRPNVLDARVIRGEPVKQQFGPGFDTEQPVDALDQRALKGEEIVEVTENSEGRVLTVLTPFHATHNTRGVNCLQCHNVPSGAVNGAIRVSYSLADMDAEIRHEIIMEALVNIVVLALGLVLVNYFLRGWVSRPLTNLMDAVTRRAAGDLQARADIVTHDEIGKVGHAFNAMADKVNLSSEREHEAAQELRQKVDALLDVVNRAAKGDMSGKVTFGGSDAIGELATGLQTMIDNLHDLIEERRIAVEDLKRKVSMILETVTSAANGDLTSKLEIEGDDAIGQLAKGVQAMIDSLNSLVAQVQRSGIQVTSSATQIAATAKEQEATVAEQAATVNQIVATSTEISATAKELVSTMDEVSTVAEVTANAAASGQSGLQKMESTMHQVVEASSSIAAKLEVLNEKASNINTVVTTITKVADQTNLLSLNAAIEAEKAGEYGLGFSVVATEIRRLADQTAVATWDIEQMVKEMQAAVTAGVMSVERFSEEVRRSVDEVSSISGGLAEIIDQVQALTPRFESVHEGMQFQSQGAEQIKQAIVQLSESAQQTVDSLRQSHKSIDHLNEAAHRLQNGVSKFKVSSSDSP